MQRKSIRLLIFLGMVVLLAPLAARARQFKEHHREAVSRQIALSAGPVKLSVDNIFGSVKVRSHNERQILITGERIDRARDAEALGRARREVSLQIDPSGNNVRAIVDGPFRNGNRVNWDSSRYPYEVVFNLEILVPRQTALNLKTVNGGTISVTDVEGDFQLSNVNGSIEAEGLSGTGEARTVNGKVIARFNTNPGDGSEFRTVNGNVEVFFQENLGAELVATTVNGDLYSDFELAYQPGLSVRLGRGGRSMRLMRLKVGDGGPELLFRTVNGDILIRKQ